jgi:alpha-tubulin suppressor-like RCC1 family protein
MKMTGAQREESLRAQRCERNPHPLPAVAFLALALLAGAASACSGDDDGPAGGGGGGGGTGAEGGEPGTGGASGNGARGGAAGSSSDGGAGDGAGGGAGDGAGGDGASGGEPDSGGTAGSGPRGGAAGAGGDGGASGDGGMGGEGGGDPCESDPFCSCLKVEPTGDDTTAIQSVGMEAFRTLRAAVTFVASHPELTRSVCVAGGSYDESLLSIPAGVSVYGGFDAESWSRTGETTSIVPHDGPVRFASDTDALTRLDGVSIDFSFVDTAVDVTGERRVLLSNVVGTSAAAHFPGHAIVDVRDNSELAISGMDLRATYSGPTPNPGTPSVGIRALSSRLTVDDSTIVIEASIGGNFHAIYLDDAVGSRIHESDIAIQSTTLAAEMSAIRALGDVSGIEITESRVTATLDGTALWVDGLTPSVFGVDFQDCTAGSASIANNHSIAAESADEVPLVGLISDGVCDGSCGVERLCSLRIEGNESIVARGSGGGSATAVQCGARSDCIIVDNPDIHTTSSTEAVALRCFFCSLIERNVLTGLALENGGPPTNIDTAVGLELFGAPDSVVRANRTSGGCGARNAGVALRTGSNTRFENNVIRGFAGHGVCGFNGAAHAVITDVGGDFHSNVIDAGASGSPCVGIYASGETGTFRNNIILAGTCAFPQVVEMPMLRPQYVVFEFNDLVGAPSADLPGTYSSHNFTGDPRFVDYPNDLGLLPDSPCIDTGTSFDAPSEDVDGLPRDAKPDVGIHENEGSPPADPCTGVSCGGDGTCDWFGDHAACVCRDADGNAPDGPSSACGAKTCADDRSSCDPRTACVDIAEGRACSACPVGYVGTGETGCSQPDPCVPNPCVLGECTAVEGVAACTCPPGVQGARCDDVLGSPAAGAAHVCTTGSARCWGLNTSGQATPAPGPFLNVAGGDRHTCAIRGVGFSGPVVCWGDNNRGQTNAPTGTFLAVAAGAEHTCAQALDRTVMCWGNNDDGQASPPPGQFYMVATGDRNSCAIRDDNQVVCWGSNAAGQSSPGGTFGSISLGAAHGCGRRTGNYAVACWGDDTFGQVSLAPNLTAGLAAKSRGNVSCYQTSDDRVTCWGEDVFGGSNPPNTGFREGFAIGDTFGCGKAFRTYECWGKNTFGEHVGPGGAVLSVSLSYSHGCSVSANGSVTCWGSNDAGESNAPAGVFEQVTTGDRFTCGRKSDGTLACWGGNGVGQGAVPAGPFAELVAGAAHACARRSDGSVACFGSNASGQASPPPSAFVAIAAGASHTCGLRTNGAIECWGSNGGGQATPPPGSYKAIAAAANHTCALPTAGGVTCFGASDTGALPPAAGEFDAIAAGPAHDCAVGADGGLTCWGQNLFGALAPPAGTFRAVTSGNAGQTCAILGDRTLRCWGALVR